MVDHVFRPDFLLKPWVVLPLAVVGIVLQVRLLGADLLCHFEMFLAPEMLARPRSEPYQALQDHYPANLPRTQTM